MMIQTTRVDECFGKYGWQFFKPLLKWLNVELLYDPAILLLGISPKGKGKHISIQKLVHECL